MKKSISRFVITFACSYIILSLPAIFGIGYVIDWVEEATIFQKFKGYVVEGLLSNWLIKGGISAVLGLVGVFMKVGKTRND